MDAYDSFTIKPLTRYMKLRAHAPGMPGTFSPSPCVSDPDMHHVTCVTHVPWCMPGSLTSGFLWSRGAGKMFPAFLAPIIDLVCQKCSEPSTVWLNRFQLIKNTPDCFFCFVFCFVFSKGLIFNWEFHLVFHYELYRYFLKENKLHWLSHTLVK